MYGCETWSLTLKKEHRVRVLENGVLRRIFVPNREEVAGGWKRLYNEIHNFYTSPNIIMGDQTWKVRWARHVACMENKRKAYEIVIEKLKETDHLEDPGIGAKIILE